MPTYRNVRRDDVHLVGSAGSVVIIKAGTTMVLDNYFDRYVKLGMISREEPVRQIPPDVKLGRMKIIHNATQVIKRQPVQPITQRNIHQREVVGRRIHEDATPILQKNLQTGGYPVSNGIGVGILSYNRAPALKRLIESIRLHTNLRRTTVFISDDGSTDPATVAYLAELSRCPELVVLRNQARLGVAGNSNRLLRCLARFQNLLLLNDDVEILADGWDQIYPCAAQLVGIQHFMHNQPGVYGSKAGAVSIQNGVQLCTVQEKPHGAVLFATHQYLERVGYFDESYGFYGFEHVDWSSKAFEFGLQPPGYHDLAHAHQYFKIHPELSAVANRSQCYQAAKAKFATRVAKYCEPSLATVVPSISYVIPFRNTDRQEAIRTVVNNVRAQRFPVIDITVVEQDDNTQLEFSGVRPLTYVHVGGQQWFNKSLAFNCGVELVRTESVILHDADILVPSWYTAKVYESLGSYPALHIGAKVIYADQASSDAIELAGQVAADTHFERVVGYYEGGSLACKVATYWAVGGFNEDFHGYGCEDCDFFYRLSNGCGMLNGRYVDLLHLWHGRTAGWEEAHRANKQLEHQLREQPIQQYIDAQAAQVAHYREAKS